jgi:hypothetical protein
MNTANDNLNLNSIDRRFFVDRNSASWRAFVASGLWLRGGFVGASVFAIGLILLFTGEASALTALTCLVAGGAFAAFAWRRAWAALNRVEASFPGRLRRLNLRRRRRTSTPGRWVGLLR